MAGNSDARLERLLYPLVRYLHDCLAAQVEWGRTINVLGQRDVFLLPLTRRQQARLGRNGSLALRGPKATELGNRFATGGSEVALSLGALFLVGRTPATGKRPARRYCAPLLEVPLGLRRDLSGGRILVEPEEVEFSVNYGLLSEILGPDEEDLQDRLADLAELVPDFPIDEREFRDFWNGFRMIAAGLPLAAEKPRPQRGRQPAGEASTQSPPSKEEFGPGGVPGSGANVDDPEPLRMVDFYVPAVPADGLFRMLPATTIILGRRTGHVFSALEELRGMTQEPVDRTAFGCLFDPESASPAASRSGGGFVLEEAFPMPLTRTQEAVVRSARTAPLTVVTGPPGTGKSYTITAIVLDSLLRGESVLVASQMDKAVEVVARQVEKIAGPFAMARSGGRAAQRELAKKITRLTGPRARLAAVTAGDRRATARRHREISDRVAVLEERYRSAVQGEQAWNECWDSYQRLASLCPLPVREISPRTWRQAQRAASRARRSLDGRAGRIKRWWGRWQKGRALQLLDVPGDWDCSLEELDEALRVQELRLEIERLERALGTAFPTDLLWKELSHAESRRTEAALQLLRLNREAALGRLVRDRRCRGQLRDFGTLLRRRNLKLKRELRNKIDPSVPLEAFPAWASTNRALGQILPATPAAFDVVVIDEASQCELATAAVALLRGKRAVIVGDPNQLRHVCFLSKARQQAAAARCGLGGDVQQRVNYRRSLFDVAADVVSQDQFFMLDQHFRSDPHIIAFSNERFYEGQLRIMTERPRLAEHSAIRVVRTGGRRAEGTTWNPAEVDAVLDEVAAVIEEAKAGGPAATLGIVSPFRDQVDAIRERLVEKFPAAAIDRHEIVIGTAHSLQGDEKDLVILSTSIDPGFHFASLSFLENPNLFNVAVTRARKQMVVVASVGAEDLPPGILREYLEQASGTIEPHPATERYDHDFERDLALALRKQEVALWPNFLAAGVRIDLAASCAGRHLAVLCDGPLEGRDETIDPLTCHRLLARAGWNVARIPRRSWLADWYACVAHVLEHLGRPETRRVP